MKTAETKARSWLAPLLLADPAITSDIRDALTEAWGATDEAEQERAQRRAARLLVASFDDLSCADLGELVGADGWATRALSPCGCI